MTERKPRRKIRAGACRAQAGRANPNVRATGSIMQLALPAQAAWRRILDNEALCAGPNFRRSHTADVKWEPDTSWETGYRAREDTMTAFITWKVKVGNSSQITPAPGARQADQDGLLRRFARAPCCDVHLLPTACGSESIQRRGAH